MFHFYSALLHSEMLSNKEVKCSLKGCRIDFFTNVLLRCCIAFAVIHNSWSVENSFYKLFLCLHSLIIDALKCKTDQNTCRHYLSTETFFWQNPASFFVHGMWVMIFGVFRRPGSASLETEQAGKFCLSFALFLLIRQGWRETIQGWKLPSSTQKYGDWLKCTKCWIFVQNYGNPLQ